MLGQMNMYGKTKLDVAMDRIKSFEPEEGYYVAFSGGKDSQCVYHLCEMAGVKFDAHYRITSVDPPELVRFIKEQYPDVHRDYPRDKNGNVVTMWNLIPRRNMPPTRLARYCCQELKEGGGVGRLTITGVRWAESANRKANQGEVTIFGKHKSTVKALQEMGANFQKTVRGGVVLNTDNDANRRAVEFCYRTRKTMLNPIIDWEDDDVWEFLNEVVKVPHCELYDQGEKRLGCIGCHMAGGEAMKRMFKRWPTYYRAYLRAFEPLAATGKSWKDAEDCMKWWLGDKVQGV